MKKKAKSFSFSEGKLISDDNPINMFLYFSPLHAEGSVHMAVEKSLPRVKGLKRLVKRYEFTVSLVDEMKKNGLVLSVNKLK